MSDIEIIIPSASPTVEIAGGVNVADIIGSTAVGRALLQAASVAAAIAVLGGSVATLDDYLPGGSDTHVQFNDGGVLGGQAGFTFNKTTGALDLGDETPFALFDYVGPALLSVNHSMPSAAASVSFHDGAALRANIVTPDDKGLATYGVSYGVLSISARPATATSNWHVMYGLYSEVHNASPLVTTAVYGVYGSAYHFGTGTATTLGGLSFGIAAYDNGFGAPGNITTARGIYVDSYLQTNVTNLYSVYAARPYIVGSGKVATNAYGVWIGDHSVSASSGSITNGWNIYSTGATSRNYFEGKVGIGTATPAEALDVAGNMDITGLISAQNTTPAFAAFLIAGSMYSAWKAPTPTSSNKFHCPIVVEGIASDSNGGFTGSRISSLVALSTIPATAAANWLGYGGSYQLANYSPNSVSSLVGLNASVSHYGTGANSNTIVFNAGLSVFDNGEGTPGTITSASGFEYYPYIDNGAVITTFYGARFWYPDLYSGAAITTAYGIHIGDHSVTGVTNGWNIYSEGATSRNYFGGKVGIGTATPSTALHISGGGATIAGGTVVASAPVLDLTQTWNSGATAFTGIKLNVTDTASPSGSRLADFQTNGTSRLAISKEGNFISPSGIQINSGNLNDLRSLQASNIFGNSFRLGSGVTADIYLERDAADTLALRRSTNAQTFRWYYSYTDLSNRQNGALRTAASYVELAAETAGTGADDIDVLLTPAGAGKTRFGTHSALGAETVTGFITIKDAGGTERKLAVVS